MKAIKLPEKGDAWKSSEDSPSAVRELYIVVQKLEGGEQVRNAAYWEQDANGQWGWNKPNITHWMKWPEMPKEA